MLKTRGPRTFGQQAQAWSAALAVTGVAASVALHSPVVGDGPGREAAREYTLTALSQNLASTVLTLEPGIVGIQHVYHFTPTVLQGYFCAAPNTCQPVDYQTLPGDNFNELGADKLVTAVTSLPADGGPVMLMGYSQGAQVIYSALRRWQTDPGAAPDPSRVSWVSIGNPDNPLGGIRTKLGNSQPRPSETPYAGTEVIRQYDGWADWPDNPTNLLAVVNAIVGMQTVHTKYFDVNINDPSNIRYTPDLADGSPGNVTYVWVPNPVLPIVAGFGPLAPTLDAMLRPIVEKGYNRPVPIPAPGEQTAAAVPAAATLPADSPTAGDANSATTDSPASTGPGQTSRNPSATRHRTKAGASTLPVGTSSRGDQRPAAAQSRVKTARAAATSRRVGSQPQE